MTEINIDAIAKFDARFPVPEDRTILAFDGFGVKWQNAKELLPATLFTPILELVDAVEFPDLFGRGAVATGLLYRLPSHCSVEYSPGNRRWQYISAHGRQIFSVLYDRDYNEVRADYLRLLCFLQDDWGLKIPRSESNLAPRGQELYRYNPDQD
jgi:hypothetical protein